MAEKQIQFYYGEQAAFDAAVIGSTIQDDALYVITDSQRLYKGQTLIGANNVKTVDALPEAESAIPNVIYVVEADGSTTLSILNKEGNAFTTLINTAQISTWTDQIKLSEDITLSLSGQSLGGIADGTKFDRGSSLTTWMKALMRKEEAAAISKQPSLSLSATQSNTVECGTTVTPTVTASFDKGAYKFGPDTGVTVTSYTLKQKIGSEGETTVIDAEGAIREYTPEGPLTVPEGNITFTASVEHTEGAAANSSFGTPNPEVKINAGTKSATKNITGQRKLFYLSDETTNVPSDSAGIRGLTNTKLGPSNGLKFDITIPQGAKRVIFAYPATLREVTDVIQNSTNMSAKGSFTKSTVSVEGANGYSAVDYHVYSYVAAAPLNGDTFKVTI